MAEPVRLTRADGSEVLGFRTRPSDARRGGLVLIPHSVVAGALTDELALGFAKDGYEVLAPSALRPTAGEATDWQEVRASLQACIEALAPPVFCLGYGWGGAAAWLAACHCTGVSAASCFPDKHILELIDETPLCPTSLHVGRADPNFSAEETAAIAERHPEIPLHLYDAGEDFASGGGRGQSDAARLSYLRTLALFSRHGVGRGEV